MSGVPQPSQSFNERDRREWLLDAHIAEYNALTMRVTYWIAIQFTIFGLAGAYLGFAVQAAGKLTPMTLAFASMLVLQLLGYAVLQTQYEIFNTTIYLEKNLRPKVRHLVGNDEMWEYEQYLAGQRAEGYVGFDWKWAALIFLALVMTGLFLALLISAGTWRSVSTRGHVPLTPWNWFWGVPNLYVGVLLVFKIRKNGARRREMPAAHSAPGAPRSR